MTRQHKSIPRSPPILRNKHHDSPSVFVPENLLREARRQKRLANGSVPDVCILDPDGDIVRHLVAVGRAHRHSTWACYHTDLFTFDMGGFTYGIIGCAVGASYAVLVAEELFASGCTLVISITSAGQIVATRSPPYFILIDRALRDEGTSYHYQPPSDYSTADPRLVSGARDVLVEAGASILVGSTWTTDAPFRETQQAIRAAKRANVLAVEMEAAALYAFAAARGQAVLCFAHVTNQMAQIDGDFEKGAADGAEASLDIIARVATRLRNAI